MPRRTASCDWARRVMRRPQLACRRCRLIQKPDLFRRAVLHCRRSPRRLVAVVCSDEPKLAAVYAAVRIGNIKRRLDTLLHMLAKFLGGPRRMVRKSQTEFRCRYPANGITANVAKLSCPGGFETGESAACCPCAGKSVHLLCLRSCGRRRASGCGNRRGWNERAICRRVVCGKPIRWFGDLRWRLIWFQHPDTLQ